MNENGDILQTKRNPKKEQRKSNGVRKRTKKGDKKKKKKGNKGFE